MTDPVFCVDAAKAALTMAGIGQPLTKSRIGTKTYSQALAAATLAELAATNENRWRRLMRAALTRILTLSRQIRKRLFDQLAQKSDLGLERGVFIREARMLDLVPKRSGTSNAALSISQVGALARQTFLS